MGNKYKIALVKQDVYQDLYVVPTEEHDAYNILTSSIVRVGPIGLFAELNADFYIVEEEKSQEAQVYRIVLPGTSREFFQKLKVLPIDKVSVSGAYSPGSDKPNGAYAVNCNAVDWGKYDIVISLNVSIPTKIVRKYPDTLFCYMIGEANMAQDKVYFGYDVTFNQMARGRKQATQDGVIDFPYTFLGADTLQNILFNHLGRESKKEGVFMEINSTTERPVVRVPDHFKPLVDDGYNVILHNKKIAQNLLNIYDAKYFVKMGGRKIRGNSVAEAISLGTLVLMDRDEVIHSELIIDECDVKTMDQMMQLMHKLDNDDALYDKLLKKQKAALQHYFFDCPAQSIYKALEEKRKNGAKPYTLIDKVKDFLQIKKSYIHGKLYVAKLKIKKMIK